jgi:oligopeptide/dipeptide ABC transporter ATP-binding protein
VSRLLETRTLSKHFELQGGLLSRLFGQAAPVVRAVDAVDLSIAAHEVVAVVGESGSGKTTIGKLVCRLERPTSGTINFDGESLEGMTPRRVSSFRRQVQMIFQNPYESLDPRATVGATVSEPLVIHKLGSAAERREQARQALEQVELRPAHDFLERFPQDLSGGQRQRVSIARTLVLKPRLIVADEPVSMLDVSIRSGVMNLMQRLRDELGIAYLYITHDLAVARVMSTRMAVMYLGRIVEEGPTEGVIAGAGHPYTRLLLAAVPGEHAGERQRVVLQGEAASATHVASGCRFRTRCPIASERCQHEDPPLRELAAGHKIACHEAERVLAWPLGRAME